MPRAGLLEEGLDWDTLLLEKPPKPAFDTYR